MKKTIMIGLPMFAASLAVPVFAQTTHARAEPRQVLSREPQLIAQQQVAAVAATEKMVAAEGAEASGAETRRGGKRRLGSIIEEIIVTSQKREERLQDVPISISVLDGETLDESVENIKESLNRVPGVSALQGSGIGGGIQLSVRGVTAAGPVVVGGSPIGYYLDSMPFGLVKSAVVPNSVTYDLERIEVLRGPQGTLYGAGGANGVVRVITMDPNLDDFEFKTRAAFSGTHDGGENYRGDLAVNVPVVDGKLAIRAVAGYEDLSGWIDKPTFKDSNDSQLRNFRLKVKGRPTDNLSVGLSAWLSREKSARSTGTEARTNPSLIDEPMWTDYDLYGLKIGYEFPGFLLSSMTSYLDYSNTNHVDYQAQFGIPDTVLHTSFNSETFSQEFVFNSTHEGPWRWVAGGIYRDAEEPFFQWRRQYPNPNGTRWIETSKSYAVYGELTRLVLDGRLELTGGLRYFEDEVTNRETSRLSDPFAALVTSIDKFHKLSPRAVITWHPGDEKTVYASYSEGFRSGFAQNGVVRAAVPTFPPVDADNLTNYELGAKGSLWNDRVSFNTAVFYIDWRDIQQLLSVDVPAGPGGTPIRVSAPVNGGTGSGIGAEFGIETILFSRLSLSANYSWNDMTFDADVFSGGVLLFQKGDRLGLSPEQTAGLSADYVFPLGGGGYEGRFSGSANYISAMQGRRLVGGGSAIVKGDSMLTSQVSLSVQSPKGWTGTLFVDNLNDEKGVPYPAFPNPVDNIRIRPRTIGVQFDYRL